MISVRSKAGMLRLSFILCAAFGTVIFPVKIAESAKAEKCIDGPYHKNYSSPEDSEYVECAPWKNNTCCTANFTKILKESQTKKLYNFDWHHCGHKKNLSKDCERFIKEEECFYSCEPSLIKFWAGAGSQAVKNVPICAAYCNRWFDACKNDLTCAKNWVSDFNVTNGKYYCKSDSTCETFEKLYKNGEGLCNMMWGNSFKYETNTENCMKMWFTGSNPNTDVKKDVFFLTTTTSKQRLNTVSGGTQLMSSFAVIIVMLLASIDHSY